MVKTGSMWPEKIFVWNKTPDDFPGGGTREGRRRKHRWDRVPVFVAVSENRAKGNYIREGTPEKLRTYLRTDNAT